MCDRRAVCRMLHMLRRFPRKFRLRSQSSRRQFCWAGTGIAVRSVGQVALD
jgi:hypothetical protein